MAKPVRTGLRLWDRIVLLMAWAVTCGFVYLLGFYVGKGTQERRLGLEERIVRLPVTSTPPPEGQRPKVGTQLSFYDELLSARGGNQVGTPPPAPTPTTPSPAAKPPALAPQPQAVAPKPAPPAVPPATTPVAPEVRNPPPAVAALPGPTVTPALGEPATSPTAPPGPASTPATTVPRQTGGAWTVEANPTRSRDEAEALQGQLRRRGYDATLTRVQRDGDTWYRLRVGRYQTSEQASQVMRRLRGEGVSHAFVASE